MLESKACGVLPEIPLPLPTNMQMHRLLLEVCTLGRVGPSMWEGNQAASLCEPIFSHMEEAGCGEDAVSCWVGADYSNTVSIMSSFVYAKLTDSRGKQAPQQNGHVGFKHLVNSRSPSIWGFPFLCY